MAGRLRREPRSSRALQQVFPELGGSGSKSRCHSMALPAIPGRSPARLMPAVRRGRAGQTARFHPSVLPLPVGSLFSLWHCSCPISPYLVRGCETSLRRTDEPSVPTPSVSAQLCNNGIGHLRRRRCAVADGFSSTREAHHIVGSHLTLFNDCRYRLLNAIGLLGFSYVLDHHGCRQNHSNGIDDWGIQFCIFRC